MINNWKKNTVYISIMQISLLLVNFFLITIISREYGAEVYGEYASSKSLSVLIGTAAVMSLALVVTKVLAQKNENSKLMFQNAYSLILRNLMIALIILIPLTLLLNRDLPMTLLFLIGFVFNEMIHVALAYYQAKGDFVTSSKQIIIRTMDIWIRSVDSGYAGIFNNFTNYIPSYDISNFFCCSTFFYSKKRYQIKFKY